MACALKDTKHRVELELKQDTNCNTNGEKPATEAVVLLASQAQPARAA